MRICEITRGRYAPQRKRAPKRAAYTKPPKPLPKPKPPTLTPLQLKNRQDKNRQAYANTVLNTFAKHPTPPSTKTIRPSSTTTTPHPNNQERSQDEMETFIKIVRGEIPRESL